MRPPHILRSPAKATFPTHCIFFDSESDVNKETGVHSPYLIQACYWRGGVVDSRSELLQRSSPDRVGGVKNWFTYRAATSPDVSRHFWNHVSDEPEEGETLYVYAHNAEYDVLVTKGILWLARNGYRVSSWFAKGSVFILDFERKDQKIRILSTTNYYAGSLKQLGQIVGLEKMEVDVFSISREESEPYCKRDVEIIVAAMERYFNFIYTNQYGSVMSTISGQAFHIFKKSFMPTEVFIHAHEKVLALERSSYMGGRVECFRLGRLPGTVCVLDVNSMYPACMHNEKMPVKYKTARKNPKIKDLENWIKEYCLIADVTITTTKPVYPFRDKDKLIFPTGTFRTSLTTPELRLALKRGNVVKCHYVAIYEGAILFENYVETFYKLRQQTKDKLENTTLKLFLNGLYGKFGQEADIWQAVADADPNIIQVEEVYNEEKRCFETYKTFGGTRFHHEGVEESYDSFPAVAAHVTSAARVLLLNYIETAGFENVYYCDTDSLFISKEVSHKLDEYIHDKTLGLLKLEKESDNIILYAPKDYAIRNCKITGQDYIKRKGVKRGAVPLNDSGTKWQQENWPKMAGMIRRGNLEEYATKTGEKNLSRKYNKGVLQDDGRVSPIELNFTE